MFKPIYLVSIWVQYFHVTAAEKLFLVKFKKLSLDVLRSVKLVTDKRPDGDGDDTVDDEDDDDDEDDVDDEDDDGLVTRNQFYQQ